MAEEAIEILKTKLSELGNLETLPYNNNEYPLWREVVAGILSKVFGDNSREYTKFFEAYPHVSLLGENKQRKYLDELKMRETELLSIIQVHELVGVETKPSAPTGIPPKAFIAHGGETEALHKLQKFVAVLGITPLIAEDEPSEGRSVNEQVKWCLDNSDCAIILGTSDDKNLKDGKLYPRPNVCIEIGRVQERFPGKVIYLLEEGASFPPNITEKVYERFTQDNMEGAFLKTAKELKAFGIIKAAAIRKQNA